MSELTAPKRSSHPALQLILNKLHRGANITGEEVEQLRQQIADLEEHVRSVHERDAVDRSDPVNATESDAAEANETMLSGYATLEGVGLRDGGREASGALYRKAQDTLISTIGIGTYLGPLNHQTDSAYAAAVHAALGLGVNLIDTSLNYRRQRSERAVAAGVRRFLKTHGGRRDGIVICTNEGDAMFDAKFKLAAASLIRAAMVEDFDTAELIISQHDPYELTRAMAVISAQGWTITNGYNMARAVESLDVLASVFAEEAGIDRREPPR